MALFWQWRQLRMECGFNRYFICFFVVNFYFLLYYKLNLWGINMSEQFDEAVTQNMEKAYNHEEQFF